MSALAARVRAGERGALARAISVLEDGGPGAGALRAELERTRPWTAAVVGVTGPPGAGKSTLIGRMASALVASGRRVALLLVDPSSPLTGGAVLADRVRMRRVAGEGDRLFVRSVGSRGQSGGLSAGTRAIVAALDAWGADVVVIETVGAGQADVDVCRVADRTVLVCPPGLGDELQAMKAGLMEVADLFVVNKADRPGAKATTSSLRDAGRGGADRTRRRVLETVATSGDGVDALVAELDRLLDGVRERASAPAAHPGAT